MRPRWLVTAGRILTQLSHDRRTVALLLVVPALLVGLFAWLYQSDQVFQRIGPMVMALFPFILMFLVTSVATLRERRSGTLERVLTAPGSKADLICGYALAFSLVAVLQTGVTVGFSVWVCRLELAGSVLQLLGVAVVDAVLGTALGLLVSAFARTEFQAVQFLPVFVFPQIILGGVFMPRQQMPRALELISDFMPLSYAIDGVSQVAAGQGGWVVGRPLLIMAAFAVGCLVAASATLPRRTP
ncbi:MAG: ABC transporter permease [Propionibacteriaceae bacterium]|jgi:ABC transporter DrrB family efflux protein|nr:ABC transporter permease [Propionibacteriaceae bacterium]